jgi:DNA polymerase-4
MTLLHREIDGTKFRLLGVGVTDLFNADAADPDDLFAASPPANDEVTSGMPGNTTTPGPLTTVSAQQKPLQNGTGETTPNHAVMRATPPVTSETPAPAANRPLITIKNDLLPRPTTEQLRESLTRPYRKQVKQPRQHKFVF